MSNENLWNNEYNPFNKYKVLCWYERMAQIKTGNFAPPVNIALDIIQGSHKEKQCGKFSCNFCMSNLDKECKVDYIPRDILLNIPQFYNEWGVKSICIAGHNSDSCIYSHKDLIDFLRLCKQWNIEVGFVSNGAYYTDSLIEEVARTCKWSGWSINAGSPEDHANITNTKDGKIFNRILENMKKMSEYIKEKRLDHAIGYKFLVTDDNYTHILDAIGLAELNGARHFQIRPCELPVKRSKKIDIKSVKEQIKAGLCHEEKDKFEVFGIMEKFTPEFTKKPPKRCIASPLGSTWKADGNIVICPDRRWSAHQEFMTLGNFRTEGLEAIRRKWGGPEHKRMIYAANSDIKNCIRCTSCSWHDMYENIIETDLMNVTLI